MKVNHVGGVMVSMLAASSVDGGFETRSSQTKDYKLVFVASPLSMQHSGERTKTGWLGIRIMCQSVYLQTVVSVS